MIKIAYRLEHAPKIIASIARATRLVVENDFIKPNNGLAHGLVLGKQLSHNLSLYAGSVHLKEKYLVSRVGANDKNLLALDFILTSSAILRNHDDHSKSRQIFGSYFSSSTIESEAEYDQNIDARFLTLIFDKSWLFKDISPQQTNLHTFVENNSNFLLFRVLDSDVNREVIDLFQYIFLQQQQAVPYLYGSSLKILVQFFSKFSFDAKPRTDIHSEDLKNIIAAKDFLDQHVDTSVKMEELLALSAMSQTKFRNLFKLVFEVSPLAYHKKVKMWEAKGLIEAGESISNAVAAVGYINHSYFTRAFKQEFGITPSAYKAEFNSLKKI